MKGVILAGGKATRLRPLTWVTNKHLLPVYNKPMIFYSLESMRIAGINEVLITSSDIHLAQFINLLKSGKDFGIKLSYAIQEDAGGGIPQAIGLAESFSQNENILVILGDNIFTHNLSKAVSEFEGKKGAKVLAKRMPTDSGQYGVVELDKSGKVISIEEKPKHPKSDLAQTGIYMYDSRVYGFIKSLKPSKRRNELEVTDLNNIYLKEGSLTCEIMEGWWIDAGTSYDELLRANNLVAELLKSGNK